jgi:putative peptide zinc metalloprotease protein
VLGHVLAGPVLTPAGPPAGPGAQVMPAQANTNNEHTAAAQADTVLARAAVPEADAVTLLQGVQRVSVVVAGQAGRSYAAQWDGRMPQASTRLPSAALGTAGGGAVPSDLSADLSADIPADRPEPNTNPGSSKTPGLHSREPVVVVDVQVHGLQAQQLGGLGGRLYVRFDHGTQPVGVRLWQRTQQLLLRHWGDLYRDAPTASAATRGATVAVARP